MTRLTRQLAAKQEAAEAGIIARKVLRDGLAFAAEGRTSASDGYLTLAAIWSRWAAHYAREALVGATLIVRCCQYCGAFMGTKDGGGLTGVSHGVCGRCRRLSEDRRMKQYQQMRAQRAARMA